MKFKELIYKLAPFTKKIRLLSQTELIKLKKNIATRINNTERGVESAKNEGDVEEFITLINHRVKLLKDQKKIKKAISRTNFLYRINNLIYDREKEAKQVEFLIDISRNKDMFSEFFKALKDKKFVVEAKIAKIQKRLKSVEDKQKSKNNSFFTKSILILETV